MKKSEVLIDCKHYKGYKPCDFHKVDKRKCENCLDYSPIKNRILIIKLDALGDVLRTTSILPSLIKKYDNPHITWITRKNAHQLLKNNPFIDRLLFMEENYIQFINNESFDIGICLDADPDSATILSIADCSDKFGFISNKHGQVIPVNKEAENWYMMGVDDELKRSNRKTYQEHISEICKIDFDNSKPQLVLNDSSEQFASDFTMKNGIQKYQKIIGINTGASKRWPMKRWILEYFINLIDSLKSKNPEICIILFGGPDEVEFNKKIISSLNEKVIDAGCNNSIANFAALVNLTNIFLTSDSLGMHISTALNKTTITIVGPTSPWELQTYGNGEIIYNNNLDCISCYLSKCDLDVNCMNTITVEKVMEKIEGYI